MSLIIPNTFATKTGSIQLSDLDENFNYIKTQVDPLKDNISIDTSGNVGIGTSSPTNATNYKFVTTAGTNGAYYQAFGGSSTDARVFADNAYGGTGMFSNHPFLFYTNSAERMRIDTAGNVGIGTNDPSFELDVVGSGIQTIRSVTLDTSGINVARLMAQYVGGGGGTPSMVELRAGSGYSYLVNNDSVPMLFGTTGIERMRIDSEGNVGIGTSTPSTKLVVNNTGAVDTRTTILNSNGTVQIGVDSSGTGFFTQISNAALWLGTNNIERMRIKADGQLQTMVTGGSSVIDAFACRAWVNFQGNASGAFTGGTSTVSRTAGSTTATVTTTTNHGLLTGNTVSVLTGVVAGAYVVTVTSNTTFTITTVATTVLTNAAITFAVNLIRASGNVSSIADNGVGRFVVNFISAMPDTNFATVNDTGSGADPGGTAVNDPHLWVGAHTTTSVALFCMSAGDVYQDQIYNSVAIFR